MTRGACCRKNDIFSGDKRRIRPCNCFNKFAVGVCVDGRLFRRLRRDQYTQEKKDRHGFLPYCIAHDILPNILTVYMEMPITITGVNRLLSLGISKNSVRF